MLGLFFANGHASAGNICSAGDLQPLPELSCGGTWFFDI